MKPKLIFTKDQEDYIKSNWGKISISKIAKKIGCSALTITRKAEKLGLPKIESTR